jgi:uncharacterized FAD-dependent dehydrogenase
MNSEDTPYDLVVIGGGPAGIFAAYSAARDGLKTLLLEAGDPMLESLCPRVKVDLDGRLVRASERFRMQCPRCTCLTGLGGAAFHFDTNLGYRKTLGRSKIERDDEGKTKSFSSLERIIRPFDRAQRIVSEVFEIFDKHGLAPMAEPVPTSDANHPELEQAFEGADMTQSQSITVDAALGLIEDMMSSFAEAGGEVRFRARAETVDRGIESRFSVVVDVEGGHETFQTNAVVVAVGKLGLPWVRSVLRDLEVQFEPSSKIDIGVRLEGSKEKLAPLMEQCSNPKLAFINERGESVRTFCVCEGGRIMQYEFEGAIVLDGQHCLTRPTRRSNLGIVTTLSVDEGQDGTDLALQIAATVSSIGGGKPVACTVGELRRFGLDEASIDADIALDTSLIGYTHAQLTDCLPRNIVQDVLDMIRRLDGVFPGLISDDDVLAAPVIERLYPQIVLSTDMESSVDGLYFVGDASSKIIGVTYGAATGLVAARHISRQLESVEASIL